MELQDEESNQLILAEMERVFESEGVVDVRMTRMPRKTKKLILGLAFLLPRKQLVMTKRERKRFRNYMGWLLKAGPAVSNEYVKWLYNRREWGIWARDGKT